MIHRHPVPFPTKIREEPDILEKALSAVLRIFRFPGTVRGSSPVKREKGSMVDPEERKKMAEAILALLEGRLTWDEFDDFCEHLDSSDLAVWKIGYDFWNIFNPEFPSNRNALRTDVAQRCILFLHSRQEYSRKARYSGYWPFLTRDAYETEHVRNGDLADRLVSDALGKTT